MGYKHWSALLKDKLTIREVVEHYCGKSNSRNKVKSPFNDEKTPSLHIYDKTQTFMDFSSGLGGDIFKFVQKLFGCTQKKSCLILANDFGIDLGGIKKSSDDELEKIRLQRLKKKQEEVYREQKLKELETKTLLTLKVFENLADITKPYSLKNLGGYRYSDDCNLHLWAICNLERLDYLYYAIANLLVDNVEKDLEFVGFYAHDRKEQEKRQRVLLDKYLDESLDLII